MDYTYLERHGAALIQSLSMVRVKIKELEDEIAAWKQRTTLAARHDRPDLEKQAEVKVTEDESYLNSLKNEESGYIRELSALKQEIKQAEIRKNLSFDYSQILAELELLMEKPDEAARQLKELEADLALRELKQKMENDEDTKI